MKLLLLLLLLWRRWSWSWHLLWLLVDMLRPENLGLLHLGLLVALLLHCLQLLWPLLLLLLLLWHRQWMLLASPLLSLVRVDALDRLL